MASPEVGRGSGGPVHGPHRAGRAFRTLLAGNLVLTVRLHVVAQELTRNRTLAEAVREGPVPAGQHWLRAEQDLLRDVTAGFTALERE